MIIRAEVEKLGALHVVEPTVLSLYLAVPPQPAPLSLLAARADELIAVAEAAGAGRPAGKAGAGRPAGKAGAGRPAGKAGAGRPAGKQDRNSVREKVALCGRDWPGRMVAIFACAEAGLLP